MPLEIRELIIKVNIEDPDKKAMDEKSLQDYKKDIIKECTNNVLMKLRTQPER